LYSQTKLAAERIVTDAVEHSGLRAIILRPGEVVGPDRPFLSGAVAIDTGKRLVVLGNGQYTLPLVWVEDLVDAIIAAGNSEHFDGRVLHLVDPDQLSQDQIAEFYMRAQDERKRIVHAPLPLLYTAAFGAETLFRLLGRTAPLTPYRLKSAIGSRAFDCTAAIETLGWRPRVGVRAGLHQMVSTVRESN
jgi:nucleoside-diphosphate-sugar epimerase